MMIDAHPVTLIAERNFDLYEAAGDGNIRPT
jgi:hypothetical protein